MTGRPLVPVTPGTVTRNIAIHAALNAATAIAMAAADPGVSPGLAFLALIAPLPVWAAVFAASAVAMCAGWQLVGRTLAVPAWLMLGVGAAIGVTTGVSRAPAASIIFTALIAAAALSNINILAWRRHHLPDQN